MSVEGLQKIRNLYFNEGDNLEGDNLSVNNRTNLIDYFMKTTIATFKDQSDMIADLRKEIAKREVVL